MEIMTNNYDYNNYSILRREIRYELKKEKKLSIRNIKDIEIIEGDNFYYIFNLFNIFDIIKLDKKIKKENYFNKIINYLNKNKKYDEETKKNNIKKIKYFIFNLMDVEQFDLIIKGKEKKAFQAGKIKKLIEIKEVLNM